MLINADNWLWYYSHDSRVYLDGVLQEYAVEAFPEEGWVLRYPQDANGKMHRVLEKVHGNVEIRGTLLTEDPFSGLVEVDEEGNIVGGYK